jgi:hypothetical protein
MKFSIVVKLGAVQAVLGYANAYLYNDTIVTKYGAVKGGSCA